MPGMKRPYSDEDNVSSEGPQKRLKVVQRGLRHKQPGLPTALPLEDSAFFGSQLIRSISIALKAAGFDGVSPAALEAFRGETEEYMLHFCSHIRQSMSSARRTQPIPSDFVHALARNRLEPDDLIPQLNPGIPPSIAQPALPPPLPEDEQPPDLEPILGADLSGAAEKSKRTYIPKHFPNFPDISTWKATPAFVERESDPQKLRERANEEGIQAEKALRELMAAAKTSKRRGKKSAKSLQRQRMWESTLMAMTEEDERKLNESDKAQEEEMSFAFEFDGASEPPPPKKETKERRKEKDDLKIQGPVMVNYETKYWRKSAQRAMG